MNTYNKEVHILLFRDDINIYVKKTEYEISINDFSILNTKSTSTYQLQKSLTFLQRNSKENIIQSNIPI